MPRVTIRGHETVTVESGRRLINAILDAGVPIQHPCGGVGSCASCGVAFEAGEPGQMTEAEYEGLTEEDALGTARLSCQIPVEHDMTVRVLNLQDDDEADEHLPDEIEPSAERRPVEAFDA